MTKQITKETARATYPHIIKVGEGVLHNLLRHEQPKAYTTDMYGWDADVYEIDGIAIVTGYKPFGNQPSNELVDRYEGTAKEIRNMWLPEVETKELLHTLAVEFVNEAVKEGE